MTNLRPLESLPILAVTQIVAFPTPLPYLLFSLQFVKQTGAPILNTKTQGTVSATEHSSDSMVTSSHGAGQVRLDFQDWLVRFGRMTSEPMSAPEWFRWAVSFGFTISPQLSGLNARTTLVITTPCDSAIASAVALGMSLSCVPSVDQQIETDNCLGARIQRARVLQVTRFWIILIKHLNILLVKASCLLIYAVTKCTLFSKSQKHQGLRFF